MSSPLRSAFTALKFDADAVRAIYADANTIRREAIGTIVASVLAGVCLGGLLGLCGSLFPNVFSWFSPLGWFWVGLGAGIILALLAFLFSIGITHVLATWLGGTGSLGQYLAAFVWTSVPLQIIGVLSLFTIFIPGAAIIQLVVTVYTFAVQIFVVRTVYSLSWFRAIVAVLVPLAIVFVLFVLVFIALAAWGLVIGVGALQSLLQGLG